MNKYDKKNVILELLSKGIPGYIIDTLDINAMYENLMAYVNDGIGFKMSPEVVLCHSNNIFGTADTIAYSDTERFLRIHDYKSGTTPAHMEQLLIYAALFCLEYRKKPSEFDTELRIYQNNKILVHDPGPDEIASIMDIIVTQDKIIANKEEV
jgi:hypothetical protein